MEVTRLRQQGRFRCRGRACKAKSLALVLRWRLCCKRWKCKHTNSISAHLSAALVRKSTQGSFSKDNMNGGCVLAQKWPKLIWGNNLYSCHSESAGGESQVESYKYLNKSFYRWLYKAHHDFINKIQVKLEILQKTQFFNHIHLRVVTLFFKM